jgi:hypothetical protein
MNPFAWLTQLVSHLQKAGYTDEDPPADEAGDPDAEIEPTVVPEPQRSRVLRVGAWAGWGSMASDNDVGRDVSFAASIGLARLDIVCNDHARDRSSRDFGTYNKKRILALAQAARGAGLEVHLMTWCMPHEDYLRGMAEQMIEIADSCGAASIQLDAEEPWTQAKRPMGYVAAAQLVHELLDDMKWGVTGIGYAPVEKVGPLVRVADYMVPQCYSTSSSGLNPATVAQRLSARWRNHFGDRELVVGLAAYRQGNLPGHTTEAAVAAAFKGAKEVGANAAVYWSLRHLRSSKLVAKSLREAIASQGTP